MQNKDQERNEHMGGLAGLGAGVIAGAQVRAWSSLYLSWAHSSARWQGECSAPPWASE